jgi:hypothetical protein
LPESLGIVFKPPGRVRQDKSLEDDKKETKKYALKVEMILTVISLLRCQKYVLVYNSQNM